MTLVEIGSPDDLKSFLQKNGVCLVTFSAHWCGPCKASKPQLEVVAKDAPIPFGYCYESDLGDFLHTFNVRAFPTYICFVSGKEVDRVEGVNFAGIQEMMSKHAGNKMPETGGHSLGGGAASKLSPEEARKQRLAKLAAASPPAPAAGAPAPMETETKEESTTKMEEDAAKDDVKMEDASGEDKPKNPIDDLDAEAMKTLTESMGFSLLRAQKGLIFSQGGTVESAVEWLMEHQDDVDIDEPIPEGAGSKAQSYKVRIVV